MLSGSENHVHIYHNLYNVYNRYRGHVPTMKFDYGETYGNHTNKYFQDFRSSALDTSKSNYCKGGYFPTYYSYNPDIATEARTRKWDRWLQAPRYTLTNRDHDRQEELIKFDKVSATNVQSSLTHHTIMLQAKPFISHHKIQIHLDLINVA